MLKELIRRKERLEKEIELLEKKKKSIMSVDIRENTKLRNRIKKLEYELDNLPKQQERVIKVLREQLDNLNSEKEIKSQTKIDMSDKEYLKDKATELIDNIPDNKINFTKVELKQEPKITKVFEIEKHVGEGDEIHNSTIEIKPQEHTKSPLSKDRWGLYRE